MAWQQIPHALGYVAVAAGLAVIAVLTYRHRQRPGAKPLLGIILAAALWNGAAALEMARTDLATKVLFGNLTYLGIATLPVAFLFFTAEYTNRDVWLTRYGPLPLLVVPAITQAVVWTNGSHNLMWTVRELDTAGAFVTLDVTWGPWFWAHSVYSYGLIVVGTYLLLRMLVVSDDIYRDQMVALLTGVAAPTVSNALFIGGIVDLQFDPTPIAFAITALAFMVALYRHQLLDLVPIAREVAREELMDSLTEGVLVLDEEGRIADVNARTEEIFDTSEGDLIGEALPDVEPGLAAALETDDDDLPEAHETEIALRRDGTLRHYDVRVTALHRGGGLLAGRLVSLRDVTDRRQREQRLDVLNRALRHDLRNDANVILGYAELGMKENPDAEWVQAIQEHVSDMIDLSKKARQIEEAIGNSDVTPCTVDVVPVVEEAVATVEHERPDVDIETDLPDAAPAQAIEFVGAAITNALENAVQHNDNPDPLVEVSVSIRTTDEGVLVEIADNGPGIHPDEQDVLLRGRETQLDHVSGLGLWIINWIVTESGGEVRFEQNDPRGSVVTIRLPSVDAPPEDVDLTDPTPAEADDPQVDGPVDNEQSSQVDVAANGAGSDPETRFTPPVEESDLDPQS